MWGWGQGQATVSENTSLFLLTNPEKLPHFLLLRLGWD